MTERKSSRREGDGSLSSPLLSPDLTGIPLVETDRVPLTRINEHGEEVPALCWVIGGKVYVHPKRMVHFESLRRVDR